MKTTLLCVFFFITVNSFSQNKRNDFHIWMDQIDLWIVENDINYLKVNRENSYFRNSLFVAFEVKHLKDSLEDSEIEILALYYELFYTVHRISQLENLKIRIQIDDSSGYCNVGINRTTIRLNKMNIINLHESYIPPKTDWNCMLAFDVIYRKEKETKESFESSTTKSNSLDINSDPQFQNGLLELKDYFEELAGENSWELTYLNLSNNYLALEISNIRGLIITESSFWEQLNIAFVLHAIPNVGYKLLLFFDGQYAAGLSSPSKLAYQDIEPKYTSHLYTYGKALLVNAQEILIKND